MSEETRRLIKALPKGAILENRYRILRILGEGGMSRVYLAEDTRLGVRVAVKENLQTSRTARAQFQREAKILAGLCHPNLPRVTDHFIDSDTGRQYLVMNHVEGEDLQSMVKRRGPIPEKAALAWIRQVIGALEYLHRQKPPVIHRDVKPGNIKITPEGKAVLVDFGIAKTYAPGVSTLTGARAVTPGYAPPEQYGMRTTERSDIYALGATLYTMLTGRVPPEAPLRMAAEERLIPPRRIESGISPQTEAAILEAMELETTKRWQTISELRAALEGRLAARPRAEAPTVARIPRPSVPLPTARKLRAPLLVGVPIILIGLVTFLLFVGAVILRSIAAPPPTPTLVAARATLTATPRPPTATRSLPTPTLTPPTPSPACMADATFVTDVTVPDRTSFSPGETINKVWRIKNSGTCPWGAGYELAFVSGDQMGAPTAQAVLNTAPGNMADIGVTMYAPSAEGSYTGTWRMRSPTGIFFGRSVTIVIQVVEAGTPVPSTPTTAPPTPTPTSPPLGVEIDFRVDDESITAGDCTTLRWDVENATAVYLDGTDVTGHGHQDVCPDITTTYTLRVEHAGGTTEETVTVVVTVAATVTPTAVATIPVGCDWRVDLGNEQDETVHNLQGWAGAWLDQPVSPSGDTTFRYQPIRGEASLQLCVPQSGVAYLLTAEVQDYGCDDSFQIYVNGHGPVYSFIGSQSHSIIVHTVVVPAGYVRSPTVEVTFKNTATDECGAAGVYNVALERVSQ